MNDTQYVPSSFFPDRKLTELNESPQKAQSQKTLVVEDELCSSSTVNATMDIEIERSDLLEELKSLIICLQSSVNIEKPYNLLTIFC